MTRHRPSDPRARHRSCRGVRRRRLDRLGRSGRGAARRPAERRRRSGPGLLRPRRHRANRHRLQSPARLSRQGLAARRRSADRSCSRRSRGRASASPSRSASMCARRPLPSSMSSTTRWRKRSRSSPCSAATIRASFALAAFGGAGPLHAAALAVELGIDRDHLSAHSRRLLGAGPCRQRVEARLRPHRLHHAPGSSDAADPAARWKRPSRPLSEKERRMLDRAGVAARAPAASNARSMRATSANPTSSRYRLHDVALDDTALAADRGDLPRAPPADLRPRQPRRAGAARQRPGHRNRRDPTAARSATSLRLPAPMRSRANARSGFGKPALSMQLYMIAHACPPES